MLSSLRCRLARFSALLLLPLLTGCIIVHTDRSVWEHAGSGRRAQVERRLPSFRSVELDTGAAVRVRVGGESSARLSGDDDLLSRVRTEVRDGILTISLDRGYRFRAGLRVELSTPRLDSFSVDGAGDVELVGLEGPSFQLDIDGAGDVTASGAVDRLDASIDGAGSLSLEGLAVRSAFISIDGAGSVGLMVSDRLDYEIDGTGSVVYRGAPRVSGSISGSGSVSRSSDPR